MSASRCTSSAVAPLSSSSTVVRLSGARVTRPSLPSAFRCTVPRVVTLVLLSNTPACCTSRPVRVTSPVSACTRPAFVTLPATLCALNLTSTSLPRVLEVWLASVPSPLRMTKLSPAASIT